MDYEVSLQTVAACPRRFSPAGRVIPSSLPAGQVATTIHRGPYDGLEAARNAVHARLVVTEVPSIVWAVVSSLWVARLLVSDATAQKLSAKHGLDRQEVHDAIVCIRGLRFTWQHHPERGRRAMVEIVVQDRRCIAVLYPVSGPSSDVFALGSAYPNPRRAS
jgi:hypothetical protein